MVKSREFHSQILKRGKKRGWHWIKGEGDGSHRIYEDKNGITNALRCRLIVE